MWEDSEESEEVEAYFKQLHEEHRQRYLKAAFRLFDMDAATFDALQSRCKMGIPENPSTEDNQKYARILAELYK